MTWQTQIKRRQLSLIAVLAVALLCAQASSLSHGVEHYFHAEQELCTTFISYESSPADIATQPSLLPLEKAKEITSAAYQWQELPQSYNRHGLTRAPPFFTV